MTGESDNLPPGGTDSAQPSTDIDNPANWNFADPDDEIQDNVKAPAAKGTEGEPDENAEGVQESDKSDEEDSTAAAQEPDKGQPKTAKDSVTVEMPDGSKLPVEELRQGYLRQADYSRKTQELANEKNQSHAIATRAQHALRAAQAFIEQTMPQRPDPNLAYSDPGAFVAQKALHDTAMERFNHVMQLAQQPQQVLQQLSEAQQTEYLADQRSKLIQAIPSVATEKGYAELTRNVSEVAKIAGISEKELAGITDHRHLVVMNLAGEALAARKAREVAKTKVANVPPVAQPKQRQVSQQNTKNREAMSRLAKTGSIHDAAMVDFE